MVSPTICIGIAVHAEPAQLTQTLHFLQTFTDPAARTVLLPDDPDDETATTIRNDPVLQAFPRYPTAGAVGMAACFNRLAGNTDADVVVLLESGVLVGPSWLERLLAALQRATCGLAGPSTNSSSNQQAITRHARADETSIRRMSGEALRRFGTAVRSLEPLYNLGDFCYAVRREVIDAIGPADEGYGVEPGWEMDYNARAARAGFRGVWVGAAYVHRSAPTERRRRDEENIGAGRRRYQDRFCGRRLRGEAFPYETHCQGDDCEHFAPRDLFPVTIPLGVPGIPQRSAFSADGSTPDPRPIPPAERLPVSARRGERPLVTAIMPTNNRPELALQSVRYFLRQDYPNAELVIVESGDPQLASLLPDSPRIRLIYETHTRSIGAMRNLGCQNARGDLIIQWDDDDWHGSKRISRQVAPIEDGEADVTALRDATIFDVPRWRFWKWSADLHRRMWVRDVVGDTLAFRRSIWDRLARYPDSSIAEEAAFLDQAVRRGARLVPLAADGLFICVRHGGNTWDLRLADDPMPAGWHSTAEPALLSGDRDYYLSRSGGAAAPPGRGSAPLVSCVMPTYDRRAFIPAAVEYFCRQDYPALELVVVDDGTDPIADLIPDDPRIRYHRLDGRLILGTKRNLACELARGEIIMHWDDDDWYSPVRVSTQVDAMTANGSDLCGMRSLPFYDPKARLAWKYVWPSGGRFWAAGTSLAYRRDLWERSKFPEVATGEDSRFVWSREVRSPLDISDTATIVAMIHQRNTVPKAPRGANWIPIAAQDVEATLDADLSFCADALVRG